MTEASFASLNPALLARKGGAKPAMRPQLAPLPEDPTALEAEKLEDLGWNDMGSEGGNGEDTDSAEVVSINAKSAQDEDANGTASESPVIVRQQKELTQRVLADAAMKTSKPAEPVEPETYEAIIEQAKAAKKTKRRAKSAKAGGKRAAFTLRLDPDRHLKLRLASTMKGMSAQALVTEALDAMLGDFEELDALAERMKQN